VERPLERRSVWDEISANKKRSFLLILICVVLLAVLGALLGEVTEAGPAATLIALALAGVGSFGSYYYSDKIVLAISRARPAEYAEHPYLHNVVEGLAIAAGLPKPRLYVIDDTAPNAFATGRNPQNAAVAVTTGLLEKLNRQELEGVIAHEMSHIQNYDIRLTSLAAVLVGSVALLSDWALRSLRWGMWGGRSRKSSRSEGGGIGLIVVLITVLFAILAPLAAQMLRFALSRRREFLADASGALLTRNPEGLASALEKIASDREPLEVANRATAPLYFVNPLLDYKGRRASLFDTHPPTEERIQRLRSF
jgi:heat shock protein HtpX